MRFDGKDNPQIVKRLVMTEYSAVTQPAQEGANVVLMKSSHADGMDSSAKKKRPKARIAKSSALLLTSSEDGHQHVLRIWDDERGGTTGSSVVEIEGAGPTWHDHPWVIAEDGSLQIGEVLGHTHSVEQDAVMSAILGFMKGAGDASQPPKSLGKEFTMPKPNEPGKNDVARLSKLAERGESIAALNADHFAFWKSLSGDDADHFLILSDAERTARVQEIEKKKAESNPVVYVSKITGREYRESEKDLADFAKRDDEREIEFRKMREKAEMAEFEKRAATELEFLPGTIEQRAVLLKAISSIEDEDMRGAAYLIVKSKSDALSEAFKKRGHTSQSSETVDANSEPGSEDPIEKLEEMAKKFAEENKVSVPVAFAKVIDTEEGRALYAEAYPAEV